MSEEMVSIWRLHKALAIVLFIAAAIGAAH
jgi:hypothetical protein